MPAQQGSPPPVFQYFSVLLEHGKLNAMESMELARPVLTQGRTDMLEKWLGEVRGRRVLCSTAVVCATLLLILWLAHQPACVIEPTLTWIKSSLSA